MEAIFLVYLPLLEEGGEALVLVLAKPFRFSCFTKLFFSCQIYTALAVTRVTLLIWLGFLEPFCVCDLVVVSFL